MKNLISVTLQKIQSFLIRPVKVIDRMKEVFEGKATGEFVRLKSKMHSMKTIDGKESNTVKGVNVATEFNEFKDTLFNEKIIRHKMKRFQSKKHKIRTHEIKKIYNYRVLMTKYLF